MTIFEKITELENRLNKFESSIPEWIPLSKYFASQYGYTLDGFRNFCLSNIEPNNFKKYGFKPITKKLEGKIYEEIICPRDKSTYYMGRVTNIYSDAPMAVEWDEMGVCSFQDDGVYDLIKID